MKKAFTLIELLVVVLIIGILAAIALPQYEKAVEKSRAAEALTMLSSMRKAIDVYIMTNGFPNEQLFFAPREPSIALDIDITAGLQCTSDGICSSKDIDYYLYCNDSNCTVSAARMIGDEDVYSISFTKNRSSSDWRSECVGENAFGVQLCKNLQLD